ncbi:MAG: hypothetical protein MJB14_03080, partial [Spirochaetes bacterium]|nr:hypothetical protein [Spirochaetota bacterium]
KTDIPNISNEKIKKLKLLLDQYKIYGDDHIFPEQLYFGSESPYMYPEAPGYIYSNKELYNMILELSKRLASVEDQLELQYQYILKLEKRIEEIEK